jgi:SAM-dependent methyltransferase
MSIPALSDWLRTPQGRYLLEWEQAGLDRLVADIFGYHALQIGLPECDFLRTNRMPFRLRSARAGAAEVHATEYDLPFASASLDLVVLPHVLEFSPQPHQVLREVERVLVPEGSVIIAGFNPFSLWGLRHFAARSATACPWGGQYRSVPRIRDWLTLLGFETRPAAFGCFAPPVGTQRWIERWRCIEEAGERWWPVCGAGYLLQGIKRVQGMRLITPRWRYGKKTSKRFSPVVQCDGRTGQHHA